MKVDSAIRSVLPPFIFLWFISIVLVIQIPISFAQNSDQSKVLYQKAEALYNQPTYSQASISEALQLYQQLIPLYLSEADSLQVADCYYKSGTLYQTLQQYPEALRAYKNALAIKQNLRYYSDSLSVKEFMFIGDIFQYTSVFDSAEYYYVKAENILDQMKSRSLRNLLYNSMGVHHFYLGNYLLAIKYFNKALSLLQDADADYSREHLIYTNNIAMANLRLGHYDDAINNYKNIMANQKEVPALIFQNLGLALKETQQFDSALLYLKKASASESIYIQLAAYNNIGEVFLQQNRLDSARYYFTKSVEENKENFGYKNIRLVNGLWGLAMVEKAADNFAQALQLYQEALINVSFNFSDTAIVHNPKDLSQSLLLTMLFEILHGKAETFYAYYQQEHNNELLINALNSYKDAVTVARHIQKSYDSDDAKLFFINKIYPLFEEVITTSYELFEKTKDAQYKYIAFSFSESSRASILSEMLKELEIKKIAGIDSTLLHEEKNVRQQITALRLQMAESTDSALTETYKSTLNDLEIMFARTMRKLQKNDKYYKLKYQSDTLIMADIQHRIGRHEAMVEYFQGQNALFTFVLTRHDLVVKKIPLPATFTDITTDLLSQLYQHQEGQKFDNDGQLNKLYQILIQPVEEFIQGKDRLIFIPDGKLNYLPFEVLSKVSGDPFLIQNYTIAYAYSATLYDEAVEEKNKISSNSLLAMAPFPGEGNGNLRSGMNPLQFSREEVEKIGGSIYLADKATKRQFLKLAGSYGIIHLATHAEADSEDPTGSFIAFYPEPDSSQAGYRLYTHELYNLRLDSAQLVVLSACEAGSGQLVNGEGIISLARAFAYAGCPNIITTLWKADDQATGQISTAMHQYLQEGYAKDEALRQAKLDYLAQADVRFRNPFYWANFIFIGDPSPIFQHNYWWWYIAGLLVIIACLLSVYYARRKRNRIYS